MRMLIAMIVTVVVAIYGMLFYLDHAGCTEKGENSGLQSRYSAMSGCQLRGAGEWTNEIYYRGE